MTILEKVLRVKCQKYLVVSSMSYDIIMAREPGVLSPSKPRKTMSNQYYSLEEVMQILGKSKSTVIREANNRLLPWELEEGKTKGRRYPKQAIDAIAEVEREKRGNKERTYLTFSLSTPADSWEEVQIGLNLYGEDDIVPYKKLLKWGNINEEMYMSIKDPKNRVVGYSSFMPIEENVITALLKDEIRERDIPDSSIKQWTAPHLSVYVATLTVRPTGNPTIDKDRGRFLLKQTLKWALSLNRQYDIKNWYGIGATKEGQRIFEGLGFKEIIALYGGERKGYLLERLSQPERVIEVFQKSLAITEDEDDE